MRVVRVITRVEVQGGAELSTLVEAEELVARGHHVHLVSVVAPPTAPAEDRLDRAGVTWTHLGGGVPAQARALRRLVRDEAPDVVHAVIFRGEVVTAAATAGLGVPTLVSLVNMQYDPAAVAQAPSARRLDAVRRFEAGVLRAFDHVHCLTRAGARHAEEHLHVRPDRVTVIPRGRRRADVAADPGRASALHQELGGGGPLLVNVGRHELQKGQDLLVEAMGALQREGVPATLAVAGREGNRTAALGEQVRAAGLGDRVRLLGARRDVADLLGAADVVCVASRWEGLGGAIVEALGAGRPVVAFGVPAVAEVLGDAAVVAEPFDVAAYATAVAGLLDDPDRRAALSERARQRFEEHFELGAVVDAWERLYGGLAEGGGPAVPR